MGDVDMTDPRPGTILERVLATMQEAEEIGGPSLPGYVELMEKIAAEAARRAFAARRELAAEKAVETTEVSAVIYFDGHYAAHVVNPAVPWPKVHDVVSAVTAQIQEP
jgi:hypothetical protein